MRSSDVRTRLLLSFPSIFLALPLLLGVNECDTSSDAYYELPACPNSTFSAPYECGGGVVMSICGSIDADGTLTIESRKQDGLFGDGTYSVRVFSPQVGVEDQCAAHNVVKATREVSVADQLGVLTFSFDSLLTPGEEKAYCVTKEDGGDPTWWCSGRLDVGLQP